MEGLASSFSSRPRFSAARSRKPLRRVLMESTTRRTVRMTTSSQFGNTWFRVTPASDKRDLPLSASAIVGTLLYSCRMCRSYASL